MEIDFLHQHPLKLYEKANEEICMGCREPISGQTYGCSLCIYFLHKSCTQLPKQIEHFFHPCPLLLRIAPVSRCNACYEETSGFIYSCEPCEFNMDVKCSQLPAIKSDGQEKNIQHFSHRHPLTLFRDIEDHKSFCKICKKLCFTQACGCSQCNYYLHISCMEFLPQKIQASFHSCPVTLLTTQQYRCGSCDKEHSGLTFRCGKCYFHLCLDCFVTSTEKSEGHSRLPLEIQHFIHHCPLFLRVSYVFMCNACCGLRSGFAYYCEKCEFNIDIECANIPTINSEGEKEQVQHFSHLHPLTIQGKIEDIEEVRCKICDQLCSSSTCSCSQCNFFLHKSCMEILPRKIPPSFHPCPLILLANVSYQCDACHQHYSGFTFRCGKCYFHLCVNCSLMSTMNSNRPFEVPREIQNFFHPCPLFLRISPTFTCNACYRQHSTFRYYCRTCVFSLDIECALIPTLNTESEKDQIQHFSHWHPLTLYEQLKDFETCCGICGKFCLSSIYGCSQCKFYLHKSCMEALHRKIQHLFHECPLVLLTTPSYKCDGCGKDCSGLTFRCGECYFQICLECALLPTVESGGHTKIQHFFHGHPLIFSEKKATDEAYCYECGECCRGNAYGCSKCNFFLHKSCAQLPQEIQNPFHPEHPLTLLNMASQKSETVKCNLCLKACSYFAFCCKKCSFIVDVECASLKPTVKYQGHNHLLTVVENIHGELQCDACYSSCRGSSAFRCMECNFDLHLICGPLPCTIKHKCHVDPLTLKDFYVEDEDEDDEFYCDACEERRDPRLCVYYCAQGCPMVCDVKCVISEVVASLRGERGDVELRTVGRHMTSKVFSKDLEVKEMERNETEKVALAEKVKVIPKSLDDIVDSLDTTEQIELNDIATAIQNRGKASLECKDQGTFPYSEEAFTQFMDRLDSAILNDDIPDFVSEHDEEFVTVGDYFVSRTLVPTFQNLFDKYGDVSAKSTLSPKLKSIIFCFLCSVIHRMRTTKVVDITEGILQEWWACLKFVQLAGFRIQFIIDHLKRVIRAHFVLQARKYTDHTSVEKNQEIEQISKDIKELTSKLEATKEQQEHDKSLAHAATASLMKQFLRDASVMKWKPAAHGLL